jgi:hypothetical protein
MDQISLINAVRNWERRLEIEDERRKANRLEPYRELPSDFRPYQEKRESIFVRILKLGRTRQPIPPRYEPECCGEIQPG